MTTVIKLAGVECIEKDWKKMYFDEGKKFIVKSNGVHQINWSSPAGFSTIHIIVIPNLMQQGRHWITNASGVNRILGKVVVQD